MPDDSSNPSSILRKIISNFGVIIVAVVLAILINSFVLTNSSIPSSSMERTIMPGDRIFGFRLAYLFSEPQRGDIVIFPCPDSPDEPYIKRIIGLPGETIRIINGEVYINDSETPLDEPYADTEHDYYTGTFEVPEGCYFMLGDNRTISQDARYWVNKYVKREDIVAKAILRYWPGIKVLH